MNKATWINGKRKLSGYWTYNWSNDFFTIVLDSVDRITGQKRILYVRGDKAEWGNWKKIE